MTLGPATLLAIVAAALATVVYVVGRRLSLPDWLVMFLFGALLVLVLLAGPLIRLP